MQRLVHNPPKNSTYKSPEGSKKEDTCHSRRQPLLQPAQPISHSQSFRQSTIKHPASQSVSQSASQWIKEPYPQESHTGITDAANR